MTSAKFEFRKKMLAGKQQILFIVLLNAPLKIVKLTYSYNAHFWRIILINAIIMLIMTVSQILSDSNCHWLWLNP